MPKRNGFICFANEYERTERARGRRFRCFKEVIPIAGRIWLRMDPKQREPYIRMAKDRQNKAPESKARKSNSSHSKVKVEPIDERILKSEHIKTSIRNRLEHAELEEGLDKEEFYAISMVYFCRTFDGGYVPAELGVAKFSIEDGVKDKMHMHINPVSIPIGMLYEAQQHSDNSHGLPVPPHALGEKNVDEIAHKLLTFLDVKEEIPLLFTDANNIPAVEGMLNDIMGHHINGKTLYVGSMAELLFQLKQGAQYHMMSLKVFPSVEKAQEILDNTSFKSTPNISCEYHETNGFTEGCALTKCLDWSYTTTLFCCPEMSVEPIEGKHYPYNLGQKPIETWQEEMAMIDSAIYSYTAERVGTKRQQETSTEHVDQTRPQNYQENTRFRIPPETEMSVSSVHGAGRGRRTFLYDESPSRIGMGQRAAGETSNKRVDQPTPQTRAFQENTRTRIPPETEMSVSSVHGAGRGRRTFLYDESPSRIGMAQRAAGETSNKRVDQPTPQTRAFQENTRSRIPPETEMSVSSVHGAGRGRRTFLYDESPSRIGMAQRAAGETSNKRVDQPTPQTRAFQENTRSRIPPETEMSVSSVHGAGRGRRTFLYDESPSRIGMGQRAAGETSNKRVDQPTPQTRAFQENTRSRIPPETEMSVSSVHGAGRGRRTFLYDESPSRIGMAQRAAGETSNKRVDQPTPQNSQEHARFRIPPESGISDSSVRGAGRGRRTFLYDESRIGMGRGHRSHYPYDR